MTTRPPYEVPPEMRDFAERSVEQARKAFDSFMTAAQRAAGTIGDSQETAKSGAMEIGRTAMGYAEQNVSAAFDFASRLVNAKDTQEILALQSEFMRAQLAAFSEQARTIGAAATRVAKDVTSDPSKKG
ncbi:MAG: phasin [Labrys sp. (in: a-proteobacteria)]|jgi:phasin